MVGDLFAGIAAAGAAVSAYFAWRALGRAGETTEALQRANADAAERFRSESADRLLVQLQRVSDLVAQLAELAGRSELVGGREGVWRVAPTRLNLTVALDVFTTLGGPSLPTCKRLAETIGVDDHYEGSLVKAAQEELAALETMALVQRARAQLLAREAARSS
jgi:hypothetical protein